MGWREANDWEQRLYAANLAALEADLARARAERDRAEKIVAYFADGYDLDQILHFRSAIEEFDWTAPEWQPILAAVRAATRGEASRE